MKETEFKLGHDVLINFNGSGIVKGKYIVKSHLASDLYLLLLNESDKYTSRLIWRKTDKFWLDPEGQPLPGDRVEFNHRDGFTWAKGIYGHKSIGFNSHVSDGGALWKSVRYPKDEEQEKQVELSVAEIAERLNIPVKQLKIVDK